MMKKKFLVLCVNFNSYTELNDYYDSIEKAALHAIDKASVDVMVADNSTVEIQKVEDRNTPNFSSKLYCYNKNLGYMGGIMQLIEDVGIIHIKNYDYVIISNVDLILTKSFFTDILDYNPGENVGWIAPRIFSLSENRDRNPKIISRPTLKRIKMLLLMYRFPILYKLYNRLIYKYRDKSLSSENNNQIYAGHGSLMVFTKAFMDEHADFKFPSFLFGEEIYFGELARLSKLKVIYEPGIVVNDIDHVSTSKLRLKDYCKMNYESLSKLAVFFKKDTTQTMF
jgi:GT2 family glycosyltransferase